MSAAIDRQPIPLMNFFRCPVCNGDWRMTQETIILAVDYDIASPVVQSNTLQRDTTCFHGHSITSLINLDRHALVDGRLCP